MIARKRVEQKYICRAAKCVEKTEDGRGKTGQFSEASLNVSLSA